jgi:hypothetical protein
VCRLLVLRSSVDYLLNYVLRAYANLELSGVDNKQLSVLAQALGRNTALKSLNLSHNQLMCARSHAAWLARPARVRSCCVGQT